MYWRRPSNAAMRMVIVSGQHAVRPGQHTFCQARAWRDGLSRMVSQGRGLLAMIYESKGAIMSEAVIIGWERALMAAEKVKERLRRATRALEAAGVAYAVVG